MELKLRMPKWSPSRCGSSEWKSAKGSARIPFLQAAVILISISRNNNQTRGQQTLYIYAIYRYRDVERESIQTEKDWHLIQTQKSKYDLQICKHKGISVPNLPCHIMKHPSQHNTSGDRTCHTLPSLTNRLYSDTDREDKGHVICIIYIICDIPDVLQR